MPKKELLSYIQKKLHEGMSQDDIMYKLTSHGWPLVEIHEGFNYIAVLNSGPSFEAMARSAQTEAPLPPQMEVPVFQQNTEANWFWNPSLTTGVGILLLGSLSIMGFLFLNPVSLQLGSFAVTGVILSVVALFVSGAILNLITRILSVEDRTLARAFLFTGISVLVAFLFGLLSYIGLPSFVAPLLSLVFGFAFFRYYYKAGYLKTLAALGLSIVFGTLLSVVFTVLGLMIGFSTFSF